MRSMYAWTSLIGLAQDVRSFRKYGVKGVIRTSYRGSPRVEGSITPCIAGVAHEPMRVEVEFVVDYEGYCKGDALPMCF